MNTLSYKTVSANKDTVKKEWYVMDATDQILGRFSSEVAKIIRGKNKTDFTPHVDCGDYVIVINAEKIRFTGRKLTDKKYVRYTGYPGGERWSSPEGLLKSNPASIIERAVKGMLPRNRLGNAILKNLFIYAGSEHPHQAQQPKELKINTTK